MKALSFTARVYKVGINPCVDAPSETGEVFQRRGFIPIAGLVNGEAYRATLVPRGGGLHRLYLNGEIRKATRTDVESMIRVQLKLDKASRAIRTPSDVASVLRARPLAMTAFRKATPSRRREILRWIVSAKRPETRQSRIRRTTNPECLPGRGAALWRPPNPKPKEAFSQLISVGAARRPYLRKTAATFRIAAACFFLRGSKVISFARRAFPVPPCACLRAHFSSHRISVAARV